MLKDAFHYVRLKSRRGSIIRRSAKVFLMKPGTGDTIFEYAILLLRSFVNI